MEEEQKGASILEGTLGNEGGTFVVGTISSEWEKRGKEERRKGEKRGRGKGVEVGEGREIVKCENDEGQKG